MKTPILLWTTLPELFSVEPGAAPISTPKMIVGVVFIVVWLLAALAWAAMSLMGGIMANDSGRASTARQMLMLVTMYAGQALVAAAGISAGLAFFLEAHRARLIYAFVGLLITGVAVQVLAMVTFFRVVERAGK